MTPNADLADPTASKDRKWSNSSAFELSKNNSRSKMVIVIIDPRALFRECLARCLENMTSGSVVLAFRDVASWQAEAARHPTASLVLLCIGARKPHADEIDADIALISQQASDAAVILLADGEDPVHMMGALENGIRGYIPTTMTLDVAIWAMHLVMAGGTYIPATSFLTWRSSPEADWNAPAPDHVTGFTVRQSAVLKALREGKANKTIAYELNMRESTVKVHVRNIMRRLNARNRTEVAFKTRELFPEAARAGL